MTKTPGSYIVARIDEDDGAYRFVPTVLVLATPQDAVRSSGMGPGRYKVIDLNTDEVSEYIVKGPSEVEIRKAPKRG